MSVCFRQLDEIGQRIEIGFRFTVTVVQLLPLANHAEVAVIEGNDVHRNAVLETGGQFLDVHLNRTFAGNTEHILIRSGKFRTYCIRQTYAHRAQSAGVKPLARAFERIILRREHLVLPYIRSNDGGVVGDFGKFLYDVLRLDDFAVVVKPQAVTQTPFFDAFPPFV